MDSRFRLFVRICLDIRFLFPEPRCGSSCLIKVVLLMLLSRFCSMCYAPFVLILFVYSTSSIFIFVFCTICSSVFSCIDVKFYTNFFLTELRE